MAGPSQRGPLSSAPPLRGNGERPGRARRASQRRVEQGRHGGPFKEAARDTVKHERRAWLRRLFGRLIDSITRHHDATGGSADTGAGGS